MLTASSECTLQFQTTTLQRVVDGVTPKSSINKLSRHAISVKSFHSLTSNEQINENLRVSTIPDLKLLLDARLDMRDRVANICETANKVLGIYNKDSVFIS